MQSLPYAPDNFVWLKTPTRDDNLAYLKAWRERNPTYHRERHLREKYDLTDEGYEAIFQAQRGRCAICGQYETSKHRKLRKDGKRDLAVDHDHATNKPRALLCTKCNTGLGGFNDDLDLFAKAADYVREWREAHSKDDVA